MCACVCECCARLVVLCRNLCVRIAEDEDVVHVSVMEAMREVLGAGRGVQVQAGEVEIPAMAAYSLAMYSPSSKELPTTAANYAVQW